jgi:hypothetical protein
VLGQVAAKRGDLEEAGGHFGRAMEAAKTSRSPLVEVLTARDWARSVVDVPAAARCDWLGISSYKTRRSPTTNQPPAMALLTPTTSTINTTPANTRKRNLN